MTRAGGAPVSPCGDETLMGVLERASAHLPEGRPWSQFGSLLPDLARAAPREKLRLPSRSRATDSRVKALTVMEYIANGMTYREIAELEGVSPQAAWNWLRNHPDIRRRAELARAALRLARETEREKAKERTRILNRAKPRNADQRRWSDDELMTLLREGAAFLGQPLSSLKFQKWLREDPSRPTNVRTFNARFGGTWLETCRLAGVVTVGGRGPTTTREACEAAALRVAIVLGHPPTHQEYVDTRLPNEPGASALRQYLGGGHRWSAITAWLIEQLDARAASAALPAPTEQRAS